MRRTTIMLSDDVDDRLRLEARRRGTSIAEVAREALEAQLPPAPEAGSLGFFAIGEGGPKDASERVDNYVGKAIARKRTSRR
jgi:plasmid stability protein